MLSITRIENNRITKFAEFATSEEATDHALRYSGLVYDGTYSRDLWVENGVVTVSPDLALIAAEAAEIARQQAELEAVADAKADTVTRYLATHTPLECYQYVQTTVTNLTEAKQMLGKFAAVLSVMARRL